MAVQILVGNCVETMRELAPGSADSIVCDPPYELGFMGKSWDNTGVATDPRTWAEALRVAKPGAYLVAFGGTRTFHRLACAIEDAGWELRDSILRGHMPQPEDCPWLMAWAYGSGFPKSHNGEWGGTALKPAWEPIVLARKPLAGTVEENWKVHGTGALNIDGCRIAIDPVADASQLRSMQRSQRESGEGWGMSTVEGDTPQVVRPEGRWPANLVHDGSTEVLASFPEAPGQQGDLSGHSKDRTSRGIFGDMKAARDAMARGDTGSAARFFYCAKASQEDREEGLSGAKKLFGMSGAAAAAAARGERYDNGDGGVNRVTERRNVHPTVKPTDLMRWLVRLVVPKDGVMLDPFMGSGSTGKAAMLEGRGFIGIDLSPEYVEIARARIEFAKRQGHQPSLLEAA